MFEFSGYQVIWEIKSKISYDLVERWGSSEGLNGQFLCCGISGSGQVPYSFHRFNVKNDDNLTKV